MLKRYSYSGEKCGKFAAVTKKCEIRPAREDEMYVFGSYGPPKRCDPEPDETLFGILYNENHPDNIKSSFWRFKGHLLGAEYGIKICDGNLVDVHKLAKVCRNTYYSYSEPLPSHIYEDFMMLSGRKILDNKTKKTYPACEFFVEPGLAKKILSQMFPDPVVVSVIDDKFVKMDDDVYTMDKLHEIVSSYFKSNPPQKLTYSSNIFIGTYPGTDDKNLKLSPRFVMNMIKNI